MDHPPDTTSLLYHFAALKDPRQRVKVIYPLPAVLNADESQLQEPAGQGLMTPGRRLALAN
jgi:hypothetical protein